VRKRASSAVGCCSIPACQRGRPERLSTLASARRTGRPRTMAVGASNRPTTRKRGWVEPDAPAIVITDCDHDHIEPEQRVFAKAGFVGVLLAECKTASDVVEQAPETDARGRRPHKPVRPDRCDRAGRPRAVPGLRPLRSWRRQRGRRGGDPTWRLGRQRPGLRDRRSLRPRLRPPPEFAARGGQIRPGGALRRVGLFRGPSRAPAAHPHC